MMCEPTNCNNNGYCVVQQNSKVCMCNPHYSGQRCQSSILANQEVWTGYEYWIFQNAQIISWANTLNDCKSYCLYQSYCKNGFTFFANEIDGWKCRLANERVLIRIDIEVWSYVYKPSECIAAPIKSLLNWIDLGRTVYRDIKFIPGIETLVNCKNYCLLKEFCKYGINYYEKGQPNRRCGAALSDVTVSSRLEDYSVCFRIFPYSDSTFIHSAENKCMYKPCVNNGICVQNGTSHTCLCSADYKDNNCQTPVTQCYVGLCLNSGKCVEAGGNSYNCECPPGYTGRRCSIDCVTSEIFWIKRKNYKPKNFVSQPNAITLEQCKKQCFLYNNCIYGFFFYKSNKCGVIKQETSFESLTDSVVYILVTSVHSIDFFITIDYTASQKWTMLRGYYTTSSERIAWANTEDQCEYVCVRGDSGCQFGFNYHKAAIEGWKCMIPYSFHPLKMTNNVEWRYPGDLPVDPCKPGQCGTAQKCQRKGLSYYCYCDDIESCKIESDSNDPDVTIFTRKWRKKSNTIYTNAQLQPTMKNLLNCQERCIAHSAKCQYGMSYNANNGSCYFSLYEASSIDSKGFDSYTFDGTLIKIEPNVLNDGEEDHITTTIRLWKKTKNVLFKNAQVQRSIGDEMECRDQCLVLNKCMYGMSFNLNNNTCYFSLYDDVLIPSYGFDSYTYNESISNKDIAENSGNNYITEEGHWSINRIWKRTTNAFFKKAQLQPAIKDIESCQDQCIALNKCKYGMSFNSNKKACYFLTTHEISLIHSNGFDSYTYEESKITGYNGQLPHNYAGVDSVITKKWTKKTNTLFKNVQVQSSIKALKDCREKCVLLNNKCKYGLSFKVKNNTCYFAKSDAGSSLSPGYDSYTYEETNP